MTHIAPRHTSLLAAFTFLAAACSSPKPVAQVPAVTAAPVVDRDVTDWDESSGHLVSVQSVEVCPRVTGFLQLVSFPEGATVRQGDILMTIDPRPYEANVARSEALLEQAKTRESLAKQE